MGALTTLMTGGFLQMTSVNFHERRWQSFFAHKLNDILYPWTPMVTMLLGDFHAFVQHAHFAHSRKDGPSPIHSISNLCLQSRLLSSNPKVANVTMPPT
jgi:hypothetical protein